MNDDVVLPKANLLQTTVTPNELGLLVRLVVSDGPLEPPSIDAPDPPESRIRMEMSVQIDEQRGLPRLASIERETLNIANAVLQTMVWKKDDELTRRQA